MIRPLLISLLLFAAVHDVPGQEKLFQRDNLVAWCIVPFDAKKRGPEERVLLLKQLGFKRYAYDWRVEHLPTFDKELTLLKEHGIALKAVWFPASTTGSARTILDLLKKHEIKTQLWVSIGDPAPGKEQAEKVAAAVKILKPVAGEAALLGCKVGLYNHGNWFGEPENQLAVLEALKMPNVGIVYNLHHGHDHLERFPKMLKAMMPHLFALNLNGMIPKGDREGKKILCLGEGTLDLKLLQILRDSGYRGPVGILGHTQHDVELRLRDNLDGLDWLLPQLDGKSPGAKPKYRTASTSAPTPNAGGYLIDGKPAYRNPPITVEVKAKLTRKDRYNILAANDTKQSGQHWEIFSENGTGLLTVYVPGLTPDHVRTNAQLCDGAWHRVAMLYAADRILLYVDGKRVADQTVKSKGKAVVPGNLAIGRLVEGTLGCDGIIESVRLSTGLRIVGEAETPLMNDANTIGLWFPTEGAKELEDRSKFKNPARLANATPASTKQGPTPPAGLQLHPVNAKLKAVLIDRSESDAYLAVRVDGEGNLFVAGREAVFVFPPKADGSYGPRQEICRFPPDSIIIGLEYLGNDLYVLAANALYILPEARAKWQGVKPRRLLWGLPLDLHVSFHCLAWGPEGDLYLTHGDPLLNASDWERPDHWGHWTLFTRGIGDGAETPWRKTPYTGVGAVLRYNRETGAVKVVATGLRGPVGLAFDSKWNLFTNDNDHESRAAQYAPAKLLHVFPNIDFAWPRGWMASKSPERFDLIEPMISTMGRGVPCDLAYYDEPLLPELRGQLLMDRWDRMAINRYPLRREGLTFRSEEIPWLEGKNNARPVGVAVGRGGRVFATALYLTGNVWSPHCVSDLILITRADDEPGVPFEPIDWTKADLGTLRKENNSDSWERRYRAHQELVRRFGQQPTRYDIPASKAGLLHGYEGDNVSFEKLLPHALSSDLYERQLGCKLLARRASLKDLENLTKSPVTLNRLAATIAIGYRLTVPPSDYVPPANLPLTYSSKNAHFTLTFADAAQPVDLHAQGRVGSFTMAQKWKTLPRSAEENALFDLLVRGLSDTAEPVQTQSAYFLSLLRDERSEPMIAKTRLALRSKALAHVPPRPVAKAWRLGPFLDEIPAIEQRPLDLTQAWTLAESSEGRFAVAPGTVFLAFRLESGLRQPALLTIAGQASIWHNGKLVSMAGDVVPLDLQPGSNDLLVRSSNEVTLHFRTKERTQATLPEKTKPLSIATGPERVPPEFLELDWSKESLKGDAANGRRLFGALACAKCHAISPDQSVVGAPSLTDAKKRFTVPHLVESILLPTRQIAETFRGSILELKSGQIHTGLIVQETADVVELLQADASRRTIAKKEIEERRPSPISPMPAGVVKTPGELRDVLAYLLSNHPLPP